MNTDEEMPNICGLACPKCGAEVAIPPKAGLFSDPPKFVRCHRCDALLKPEFSAARNLIYWAGAAAVVGFSIAVWALIRSSKNSPIPKGLLLLLLICLHGCLSSSFKYYVDRRTVIQFSAVDPQVVASEFWRISLLESIYCLLVLSVMIGYLALGPDEGWRVILGAFFLWGLIEIARYISIKRSQDRIS